MSTRAKWWPKAAFILPRILFSAYQAGTLGAHTVYCTPAILPACITTNSHSLQMHEHLTINHSNISVILPWTERECIMYTLTKGPYCSFSVFQPINYKLCIITSPLTAFPSTPFWQLQKYEAYMKFLFCLFSVRLMYYCCALMPWLMQGMPHLTLPFSQRSYLLIICFLGWIFRRYCTGSKSNAFLWLMRVFLSAIKTVFKTVPQVLLILGLCSLLTGAALCLFETFSTLLHTNDKICHKLH